MSVEISDLAKNLLSVDEDCRALREEVALLDKVRRFRAQETAPIGDPPEREGTPQSIKSVRSQKRSIPLPIEAIGDLCNKTGDVTLLMSQNKKLLIERQKLQTTLEQCKADTAAAEKENAAFKERAGCSDGADVTRLKSAASNKNATQGLKCDILQACHRREGVQETLQRQTEALRKLITDLSEMKDLGNERENAAQQLAGKREELERIREEALSMRRLLERKDRLLLKEKPEDEMIVIQRAETERRVAQHKLDCEQENVRVNDASIRHRALQIAKLEARIEMIGDAVGADEAADEERIDAEQVEQIRKEIISLARLHREGGARLDILDSDLEDLDRRATGLIRTTASVNKEKKRIEKEHRKFTNAQKKELEKEQALTEQEIKQLKQEIDVLRKANDHGREKQGRH